ncbi:MAG: Ribose 5-phosphate isomerase A [uncultured Thermomicrobiales bacterium]|uniref:Ribose-5-phosphate isomerase A n=1 Tax=uncultured Thermomicrobiales bacterium TaxID=1645740 RepID=A0A6J4UAK2_9BACT|nr:MAG: Ribose 5-phosphate isomerase A [uncultured Thermomicrobiales bacterium]
MPMGAETGSAEDPALTALARAAAEEVSDGMLVGLGTGSTAEALVRELGRRTGEGLRFTGVPTSQRTASLAASVGIPVVSLDEVLLAGDTIAVGLDGADEIDPALNATKGRGGALLFEKLVALSCQRFVLIAAEAKLVPRLGSRMPIPVETVALGWAGTRARLDRLGLNPSLRMVPASGEREAVPARTDSQNLILDCATGAMDDPAATAGALKATTGVVDHGLFLGIAHAAYVADTSGTVRLLASAVAR